MFTVRFFDVLTGTQNADRAMESSHARARYSSRNKGMFGWLKR